MNKLPVLKLRNDDVVVPLNAREIPHGFGYFMPTLNPDKLRHYFKMRAPGKWRYSVGIANGCYGLLVKPMAEKQEIPEKSSEPQ